MEVRISLDDLLDGNIRFNLEDKYRNLLFSQLLDRHEEWGVVAKKLKIDRRTLFGIRRALEFPKGSRKMRFMSANQISSIQKELDIDIKEIEQNITHVKLGKGGLRATVNLPTTVILDQEPFDTINRALAEYLIIKEYTDSELYSEDSSRGLTEVNGYVALGVDIPESKINSLRARGLRPSLETHQGCYVIRYRNPGTNDYVRRIVPRLIIFDEKFAKEFGKWIGDRCGGSNRVGVANKVFSFIEDFKEILLKLKQPAEDIIIELSHSSKFLPSRKFSSKADKIRCCRTQYGDYAYRIDISNILLRKLIFDVLEENIFHILHNSKSSVKYAFYAGLLEAEGSIDLKSKQILISFGFNLIKSHSNEEILRLLKEVVEHTRVLKSLGLNPQISRKMGRLSKRTLKYDLRFKKPDAIRFILNTAPFINHSDKLNRMRQLGGETIVSTKLPEMNIGLIGHR